MGVRSSKLSKSIGSVGRSRVKRSLRLLMRGEEIIPRGYVPICVGVNNDETRRFIVHATALGDEDFSKLLGMSAEEYGFCNQGVLRIPYELAKDFEDWIIKRSANPKVKLKVKPLI